MFKVVLAILCLVGGIVLEKIFGSEAKNCKEKIEQYENVAKNGERFAAERALREIDSLKEKLVLNKRIAKFGMIGLCLAAALIFVLGSIAVVPTGYTGIKTTFGKVENDVLASGFNFIMPWQNVVNMDNREQRVAFGLEAFSKDIQQVDVQGSINFNIDKATAMNLYKDVGVEYPTILIQPRVQEDVKIVIAQYTAENLVENRQKASDAIFELIKKELVGKGINVISFAIENLDFTDAFEAAVEAKQVATQEKQKAQTEQERQTMEATQKAERERIAAQAEADVKKINADAEAYSVKVQAEAQAEANQKIAETLSEPLIQYNKVQRWDGKLPVVSSDGMNIVDLKGVVGE